jgi:hypothetical protein
MDVNQMRHEHSCEGEGPSPINKQHIVSASPTSLIVPIPHLRHLQDATLDAHHEARPAAAKTQGFPITHGLHLSSLPRFSTPNNIDSIMKQKLDSTPRSTPVHQLANTQHLQANIYTHNHEVKPLVNTNTQQQRNLQAISGLSSKSGTSGRILKRSRKESSVPPQGQAVDRKVEMKKRQGTRNRCLLQLQNVLLGMNPELAKLGKWQELGRQNIRSSEDDPSAFPLSYREIDILESALQFIVRTRTFLDKIVNEKQHEQAHIRSYMTAGITPEDLVKVTFHECLSTELAEGWEKLKKQGAICEGPGIDTDSTEDMEEVIHAPSE